jgi:hypothetical protein
MNIMILSPQNQKLMKKILVGLSLVFAANLGFAQKILIAPEAGLQFSNVSAKSDSGIVDPNSKLTYRLGLNATFGLAKKINLQAGAFYTTRGYKFDELGFTSSAKINYIEVPIYLNYEVVKFAGNTLFVGAGPYFAYCMGGKGKVKGSAFGFSIDEEVDFSVGSDKNNDDITAIDYGVNANVGFVTKIGIYARANYGLGLANTMPGGDGNNSIKNKNFGLSIGYNIKF